MGVNLDAKLNFNTHVHATTNVVCVKLSKNMPVSNIMIKPHKSIISLKIWYNGRSSFLFQNTIIPIQVTLLGMHHCSHILPQTIIPIQLTLLGMHHCSHVLSQSFFNSCPHNSCDGFGQCSLKVFELGPILQTLTKLEGVHVPKSSSEAENWLNCQEKAFFFYSFSQNLLSQFFKVLRQFRDIRP